jgi:hypothetical protein
MLIHPSPRTFELFTGSPSRDAAYTCEVSANELAEPVAAEWQQEAKMLYSISYDDGWAGKGSTRIETFMTEGEALTRALRLLDEDSHHGVSICDSSGNVLCGVRLQLKLGYHIE